MNRPVAVMCSPGVALGFALAGIPPLVCEATEDAITAVSELAAGQTGILFMEDVLYEGLPDSLRARQRAVLPIIVPFPTPARAEHVSSLDYVVELLRRAIGYRVRLR